MTRTEPLKIGILGSGPAADAAATETLRPQSGRTLAGPCAETLPPFRFRDLSAAPAMAVRSLGPLTTMSVVFGSVTS
jgi:hypothetical protein